MLKMMMSLLPIFFDYCYRYLFQVAPISLHTFFSSSPHDVGFGFRHQTM